jgi:hypothetical protein
MNVWQIAAGDRGRNYTDLFLDVMLIGPGNPGAFDWQSYQGVGKTAGTGIVSQISGAGGPGWLSAW